MGRVGFTYRALPVIRSVNHVVDDDGIAIRTRTGSALLSSTDAAEVVVYEADQLDLHTRTGWSVMVTGQATHVTAPPAVTRFQKLLTPWIDMNMDDIIRISAMVVTG